MRALSPTLEAQMMRLAHRAGIVAIPTACAPTSLAELRQAVAEEPRGILVWNGASRHTIWSGPSVNFMFRAWHDSYHLALGVDFDGPGERAAAPATCRAIRGARDRRILLAEVWGQVAYYYRRGAFPENQRAFVRFAAGLG